VQSTNRPIEALHVAHLENPAPAPGQIREFLCLLQGLGQGLFHEDINIAFQTLTRDGDVENRGDGHADGVHPSEQLSEILKCRHALAFARLLEFRGIDVDDADQLDPGELPIDPGVVLAYMPHPDNRHPYCPITAHRSPLTANS
jgi:hypothetical protein